MYRKKEKTGGGSFIPFQVCTVRVGVHAGSLQGFIIQVSGSKPGCAIPKALKMVPVATLLGAQHWLRLYARPSCG